MDDERGDGWLTGEELAVMTLDQIDAAGREGRVDPSSTVACQVGHHAPRCKGRIITKDWAAVPCNCACHLPTSGEAAGE